MAARQSGLPPLGLPPLSRPRTGSPQTALQPTLLLEEMMLVQAEMQVEATAAGGADGSVTIKERCVRHATRPRPGRCPPRRHQWPLWLRLLPRFAKFPIIPLFYFKNNAQVGSGQIKALDGAPAPALPSGTGSVFGVSPAYRPVRKASLPPIQRGLEIES